MSEMDIGVAHLAGDSFSIRVRGHELVVDQPVAAGGMDLGPTPTELFAASLAACVAFYAGRFLHRHGLPADGLRVDCRAAMATGPPARVGLARLRLAVPAGLPQRRRQALLAVVKHCTVHNSIRQAPDIEIDLTPAEPAATSAQTTRSTA